MNYSKVKVKSSASYFHTGIIHLSAKKQDLFFLHVGSVVKFLKAKGKREQ